MSETYPRKNHCETLFAGHTPSSAGSRVQRYNKKCKCANFEGKKVRFVWNKEQEKYCFSVIDVVQILTDSADIKQYVKRMRARDPELNVKWGTICTPVEMIQKLKVSQYY